MLVFFAIFVMGLQLGATACAISCMPIMTPILLGSAPDKQEGLSILMRYFSGKILAYAAISSIAFFGADIVKKYIQDDLIFAKIGAIIIVSVGIYSLYLALFSNKTCSTACSSSSKFGYFGIGFFSSFSFCLPVSSLITASALSSSFLTSLLYGVFFGLGVVIVPFFFFYFFIFKITSTIVTELSKFKKEIQIFSAFLIILVGSLIYFEVIRL
ncbi:MAG: sulfite exporter TauE/SafE family protein [Sulfurovaceae bacterium]|nr:sulfite exporter TauE/SafE family protein [Sulfurovaceae bacterium]